MSIAAAIGLPMLRRSSMLRSVHRHAGRLGIDDGVELTAEGHVGAQSDARQRHVDARMDDERRHVREVTRAIETCRSVEPHARHVTLTRPGGVSRTIGESSGAAASSPRSSAIVAAAMTPWPLIRLETIGGP